MLSQVDVPRVVPTNLTNLTNLILKLLNCYFTLNLIFLGNQVSLQLFYIVKKQRAESWDGRV